MDSNAAKPTPDASPDAGADASAANERRMQAAIDQALELGKEANRVEPPPRFSLLELMMVVTVLALILGLIRALGMWGAVASFVGAMIWTQWIYPRRMSTQVVRQEAMFDFVWAIVMPAICLIADPFVFKDQPELIDSAFNLAQLHRFAPRIGRDSLTIYAFIGWQMLTLFAWIVGRPWLGRLAGLFFGTWIVGVVFAGVLGILLVPISAVGSLVGIGLLGFTPLLTTYALARRLRETIDDGVLDASDQAAPLFWVLAAVGFVNAWLVPWQVGALANRILH